MTTTSEIIVMKPLPQSLTSLQDWKPPVRATVLVLLEPANSARETDAEAGTAQNESADAYPAIVAVLDAHTRVVRGSCGIQWVVQRLKNRARGRTWDGVSFCRTKEALLRCAREWVPGEHPALVALPDHFPEAAE
jgi:hypothetical protein